MCRSEPQSAVDVIRTIASPWFRSCGSGTSRTAMSRMPIQQFAFIAPPCLAASVQRALRRPRCMRPIGHGRLGDQHLARLEQLLQAAKIVADLLTRLAAKE